MRLLPGEIEVKFTCACKTPLSITMQQGTEAAEHVKCLGCDKTYRLARYRTLRDRGKRRITITEHVAMEAE